MSVWSLFFPIATVILSALCYVCYKTNKPLREKAKAEAKEKELKALKEAHDAFEKQQREDFRKKVFSDIEQALRDPDYTLQEDRHNATFPRSKHRWKALAELGLFMKSQKRLAETNVNLEARLDIQTQKIRELKAQVQEIHRLLKPYA